MKKQEKTLPTCVGFIMDGNRRWAKERELDTSEGHKKGYDAFIGIVREIRDIGIPHAVFYAFSTENWGRSDREVKYLMKLFSTVIRGLLEGVAEEEVRVRFIGERSRFSEEQKRLMQELEEKSAQYTGTTIWIAFSYGGRAEIVDAVNRVVEEGKEVTEESFSKRMWSAGMPDPDFIVRTGGEHRLSNFLPWQSVYSEFMFTKKLWPDFDKEDLGVLLEEYANRGRNFGS